MRTGVAFRAVGAVGLLLPLAGVLLLTVVALGLFISTLLTDLVSEFHLLRLTIQGASVALVGLAFTVKIRREVRQGRQALLADATSPASESRHDVGQIVERLTQLADVPTPELLVRSTSIPVVYTVPRDGNTVLVYSEGLLETLSESELEAVLAHEFGHVANSDHRWMMRVLVPLFVAEALYEISVEDGGSLSDIPFALVARVAVPWTEVGAGLFSRGRELAADDAAVALTGDPASLASALGTLSHETQSPPDEDLREHARSLDALNVLPTLEGQKTGGLTATHPPTSTRIGRLRERVRETEASLTGPT